VTGSSANTRGNVWRGLKALSMHNGQVIILFSISEKEFRQLSSYIKSYYGINLSSEKQSLVVGRLSSVLAQKGFDNFSDYYEYITSDKTGDAAVTLIDKITTNHTYFMREPEHFYYFRDKVLPFLEAAVKDKDLRIWSAGCSTGEEPYTLAMIMEDYFSGDKLLWDRKILATDISGKVLQKAVEGVYSSEETALLPPDWRINYFKRMNSQYSAVTDSIKKEVIYRKFNLMERNFPFKKKFHVIFCRNVMIYFDAQTRAALVDRFYEFTEPGGYLFIGHSESLSRENTAYKYIKPAVYRKE
jgi:chemotaxis protein methyltransferase CheR